MRASNQYVISLGNDFAVTACLYKIATRPWSVCTENILLITIRKQEWLWRHYSRARSLNEAHHLWCRSCLLNQDMFIYFGSTAQTAVVLLSDHEDKDMVNLCKAILDMAARDEDSRIQSGLRNYKNALLLNLFKVLHTLECTELSVVWKYATWLCFQCFFCIRSCCKIIRHSYSVREQSKSGHFWEQLFPNNRNKFINLSLV